LAKWKTTSIYLENGRRPTLFGKIEDSLNIKGDGRVATLWGKMDDNLNLKVNGRRPRFVGN
jgi:hypothetical protein